MEYIQLSIQQPPPHCQHPQIPKMKLITTTHLFLALLCIQLLSPVLVSALRFDTIQLQQLLNGGGEEEEEIVPGNAKLKYCRKGQREWDQVAIEYVDFDPYPPRP